MSTHFGLTSLEPDTQEGGAASLVRLVYRPLAEQYLAIEHAGSSVRLTPKPGAQPDRIRHPQLKEIREEGGKVVVELSDRERAENLGLDTPMIDNGPYVQESFAGDTVRLRRRAGDGPEAIEAMNVPTEEEEWRRFLARETQVLPYASPRHLAQLREVPTVRILEVQRPVVVALHFRVRDGSPLADPKLRQAIALGIRRGALAEVLTGRRDLGKAIEEDLARARSLSTTPVRLRLLLHDAGSDFRRAALVLEQQVALVGVDLEIEALPIDQLLGRLRGSEWEALLFFGDYEPDYDYWIKTGDLGNVGGYSNAEVDRAIAAGDREKVRAILTRDVPFTPLYVIGDGAAIDASLCSDRPFAAGDMSWLATLHRCAEGEAP